MEWYFTLSILIGLMFAFFSTGMYVAFAFLAIDAIGLVWFVGGERGLHLLAGSMYDSVASFTITPLPLFLLMAEILFRGGAVRIGLDSLDKLIGKLRARGNIIMLLTGTFFGAISGVGMSTVALLGRSLLPEMLRRGYDRRLSLGCMMAAGVLDAIIPPSAIAVLVGALANVSIAKMLIGGIVPGLILSGLFIAFILITVRLNPALVPSAVTTSVRSSERIISLIRLAPFGVIIFLILGTMQMGIATPTEAAAIGVLAAVIILPLFKSNPLKAIKQSVLPTVETAAMVLFIVCGSKAFSQVLSITGATRGLAEWAIQASTSPMLLFFLMQFVVFVLGMVIEQTSILMLCVPVFVPVVPALGFDPVWFWLVFLVNLVLGAITPPFGLFLFTAKGVSPETSMRDIYLASIPFVLLSIALIVLMTLFPAIITWLPNMVRGG